MIRTPTQNNCPIARIIVFAFICAILSTCMSACGGSFDSEDDSENECTIDGFTYSKNFVGPIPISENDCRNLVK